MAITATINQFKTLIKTVGIPEREPIMSWGPSGIGKTECVAQLADEIGGHLVDVRVSQYESVDFRGIPDLSEGLTRWNLPATLPFKGNPLFAEHAHKPIILFLDEITHGQPSTLAVCYQLLNEFRVGEHELMDNVTIVTAANLASDKGYSAGRFPPPLANRGTHVHVLPDLEGFAAHAMSKGVPHELIGFLHFQEGLLHSFDAKSADPAWPSPRTWMKFARRMQRTDLDATTRLLSCAGAVGEGPAAQAFAFFELIDKIPSLAQVLRDPEGVDISGGSDMQWAIATFVSGHMANDRNLPILQRLLDRLEPEMVVCAWSMALQRDEMLLETPTFITHYAPRYRSAFRGL